MLSLRIRKQDQLHKTGFTLVEMLVIVPIAMVVVAGLISAMVAMVGDTLVTNASSAMAFDTQNALDGIERDARVSTDFTSTFTPAASPQGKDDGIAPFQSAAGDLIFTQLSTTASPYDSSRGLIYYTNQPNACNSANIANNKTLLTHIVYFQKANPDGSKSLWRRTLVDPANLNAAPDTQTVCSAPWQRNSCTPGQAINPAVGNSCQAIDEELLDDVDTIGTIYYTSTGSTTTDPSQSKTVRVQITVTKQVAGKTLSKTGVMQVTKINDSVSTP
ncbi:MAG: hypothetical protein ABI303_03670 [Candidatus Saccharimonas sp.]